MRRRIRSLTLCGVYVVALFAAPPAEATHAGHVGSPVPDAPRGDLQAECRVSGWMGSYKEDGTWPPETQDVVSHSHYKFIYLHFYCVDTHSTHGDRSVQLSMRTGVNGLDGPETYDPHDGEMQHGASSDGISWSASTSTACPDAPSPAENKGDVEVYYGVTTLASGFVKFIRANRQIDAWGTFCSGSLGAVDANWRAELHEIRGLNYSITGYSNIEGVAKIFASGPINGPSNPRVVKIQNFRYCPVSEQECLVQHQAYVSNPTTGEPLAPVYNPAALIDVRAGDTVWFEYRDGPAGPEFPLTCDSFSGGPAGVDLGIPQLRCPGHSVVLAAAGPGGEQQSLGFLGRGQHFQKITWTVPANLSPGSIVPFFCDVGGIHHRLGMTGALQVIA